MKQLTDQAAHFACAFIPLAIFALSPNLLTGALAGFAMGMVREITEEGEVSWTAFIHALTSWRDLTFWTLGGTTAGLIGMIA